MSYFNVRGNAMLDKVCKELDVPFKKYCSLVLAFSEENIKTIENLYNKWPLKLEYKIWKFLDKEQVLKMEPNISNEVKAALYAKPLVLLVLRGLAIALAENALENGAELKLKIQKYQISIKSNDAYTISTNNGEEIHTKAIINCAGVYGDKINNMISKNKINIIPKKGQYYLLDKNCR